MKEKKDGLSQLTRKNAARLRSGRAGALGPIEVLLMKSRGKRDGSRGLPSPTREGLWLPPRMQQEQDRYAEYTDRTWGALQIAAADTYTQMAVLCDRLRDNASALASLQAEKSESDARPAALATRRRGEEDLTESQVLARRQKEEARKSAPLAAKIRQLEEERRILRQNLSLLYRKICEANHVTRHVCERVMNHSLQRMDVYWDSAYACHPKAAQMPVTPEFTLVPAAEQTYFAQHDPLLRTVEALLQEEGRDDHSISKEVA